MSGTLKKRGAPPPPPPPAAGTPSVQGKGGTPSLKGGTPPPAHDDENANSVRKSPSTPEIHLRNGLTSDGGSVTSHEDDVTVDDVTFVLVLPDGVRKTMTVQSDLPMMDLLVQAAASNKLSPVGNQLLAYDHDGREVEYRSSQSVGRVSPGEIHVVKKTGKKTDSPRGSVGKIPFEMTHRLTINLPHQQKMVLRVNLATKLGEIFTIACSEKGLDSFEHELRHPKKLHDELDLDMSLAQYGLHELKIINIRSPASRRGSDDIPGSVSMPNLSGVGTDTVRKKRGLFGFLRKKKDKDQKRKSMTCFDKSSRQTISDPPSPPSQRRSLYIEPPLPTVPELPTSPPGQDHRTPPNGLDHAHPDHAHSLKKRPAPPPPSLTRRGGEIVSAEIGPTYQASLGVASDGAAPPSITNSRRSSVISAAGVSDSTDFTYSAMTSQHEPVTSREGPMTSQNKTPPSSKTPPSRTPPTSKTPPSGKTPPTPTSPGGTIGRKKRRAPPPPSVSSPEEAKPKPGGIPVTPEVGIPAPEAVTPEPEVEREAEVERREAEVEEIEIESPFAVDESELSGLVLDGGDSPVLVSKTPPKKPPRPGTPETDLEEEVELRRRGTPEEERRGAPDESPPRRGPPQFVAPPPPAEPPQTVSVGTRISHISSVSSDNTQEAVRSSVTSEGEQMDDVTMVFDDVITEVEDTTTTHAVPDSPDRSTPVETASTESSSLLADGAITPPRPPHHSDLEITEIDLTLDTTPAEPGHSHAEEEIVHAEKKVVPAESVRAETEVTANLPHDVSNDGSDVTIDADVVLDDVMNQFDQVTSEADDVINNAAVMTSQSTPEPRTDSESPRSYKSEPTDSPRSQVSDTSDKVIILSKDDDLLDFETIRKRAHEAAERRNSKPRVQTDFMDSSPQNTITFKPSTEKEDENMLENKSLMLLNKPKMAPKTIKLDAVELNKKRAQSPTQVKPKPKLVVKPEVENETPRLKYRYKEVSIGPKPDTCPSVENLRRRFSIESVGSSFTKEVKIIPKDEDSVSIKSSSSSTKTVSPPSTPEVVGTVKRREKHVQAGVQAKPRPVTVHAASDGSAAFGFAPKQKTEINSSLSGGDKEELKGKLAELHLQFGEMQRQFQQNQTILAKQKVEHGMSRMDSQPTVIKLGRVLDTPPVTPPQPPPIDVDLGGATPSGVPPPPPGAPPPPPPIGFAVKKPPTPVSSVTPSPGGAPRGGGGAPRGNSRPKSGEGGRDDLMEAIRNKGGRSGLRKVAAKETNWAMSVS